MVQYGSIWFNMVQSCLVDSILHSIRIAKPENTKHIHNVLFSGCWISNFSSRTINTNYPFLIFHRVLGVLDNFHLEDSVVATSGSTRESLRGLAAERDRLQRQAAVELRCSLYGDVKPMECWRMCGIEVVILECLVMAIAIRFEMVLNCWIQSQPVAFASYFNW